jgi:hypothetical protein
MENVELLVNLPDFLKELKDFQAIGQSESPEFTIAWERLNTWLKDRFISSMTEEGLSEMEKYLHIRPLDSDSPDDRRQRLLAVENKALPYTLRKLKEVLTNACGEGNTDVEINNFAVSIPVKLASLRSLDFIRETVEQMLPMNMVYEISVIYNRWENFTKKTWGDMKPHTWESAYQNEKWQKGA